MDPEKKKMVRWSCLWNTIQTQAEHGNGSSELDPRDYISQLPDEILFRIFALLSSNEAAATSVLSRRWMRLCMSWYTSSPQLEFDDSSWLWEKVRAHNVETREMLVSEEEAKFIRWVNKVLKWHKGSKLEVFRVCFYVGKFCEHHVHNWIRFALAREVETLEVDLALYGKVDRCRSSSCTFPGESFVPPLGGQAKPPCFGHDSVVKSLKTISLKSLLVTDENLSSFLSSCPVLERLVVHHSATLQNVDVCGPSLALRHLEICCCDSLKSIKICETNLASFKISSCQNICLVLHNNPLLTEVDNGESMYFTATRLMLSSLFSQLEFLTLHLGVYQLKEVMQQIQQIPKLPRLKQLVVGISMIREQSLMDFACLVRASPCLQKFVMKIRAGFICKGGRKRIVRWLPEACPHNNLKVAVVEGYYGGTSDFEVVSYVLRDAVALEELIIDPRDPDGDKKFLTDLPYYQIMENAGRNFAKTHLKRMIPSQIRLSIL